MFQIAAPRRAVGHLLIVALLHPLHDARDDGGNRVQEESRLLTHLMTNYDREVRPVYNASHKVVVSVGITLTQIFDMDEKNQVLTTNIWLDQVWKDELLSWDPDQFNGIESIKIPCDKLWLPDIVLYNSADDYSQTYFRSLANVNYQGTVFWPPPTKMRSTCPVDVTYFPFDDQTCQLKLSSWMYDGTQVDLCHNSGDPFRPDCKTSESKKYRIDLMNYVKNGEWELMETHLVRTEQIYPNMEEPYPSMNVKIRIRRKTLYFMYNIVIPCMMMSSLTVLVFCLPPDSGEKIALGVTVILAFSVFMLAIAEKMPETSESIPLIGIYLTSVMALTTVSVIMTVMVLNFFYRGPHLTPVPDWAKRYILSRRELGNTALPGKQGRPKAGPSPNENVNWKKIVQNMLTTHVIGVARRGSTRASRNNGSIPRSPLPASNNDIVIIPRSSLPTSNNDIDVVSRTPLPTSNNDIDMIPRTPLPTSNNDIDMIPGSSISGTNNTPNHIESHYCFEEANDERTVLEQDELIVDHSRRSSHFCFPRLEVPQISFTDASSNGLGSHVGLAGFVNDGQQSYDELTRVIKNLLDKEERQSRDDLIRRDWRQLAMMVDRLLFWAFLIVTVFSTMMFIVVLPGINRHKLNSKMEMEIADLERKSVEEDIAALDGYR